VIDEATYAGLSAAGIAAAVRSRELSAAEIAAAALRRIDEADGAVRAFTEVWADSARDAAAAVNRAVRDGNELRLAGVPIGVKATEGTTSVQSRRLLDAGCVPVGATSTPGAGTDWQTWGHTDRGPTLNPCSPELSPGGSSAGSAVAVATGMVPLATGSDGAGSVRIPAAWCGILGLKPTNGRGPARDRAGLNIAGPLARRAEDLAAWLDVVCGVDAPRVLDRPVRVAWSADLGFATTEPEVASVAQEALDALVRAGVIEVVAAQVELLDPAPAWTAVRVSGGGRAADRLRAENDRRLREAFDTVDLIATPTTPNPPHGHDGPGTAMSVALTWAFNLSGHPAISLPAGLTSTGAPVGLQLVARHDHEPLLLAAASMATGRLRQ
jgi:amidase